MTLDEYLTKFLPLDEGVAALVEERVFQGDLPQPEELPAVAFEQVSGDQDEDLEGPTDLLSRRLEVTSWGKDQLEANAVGKAVKTFLESHHGSAAGFEFHRAFLLTEEKGKDDETGEFWILQVWIISTGGEEG